MQWKLSLQSLLQETSSSYAGINVWKEMKGYGYRCGIWIVFIFWSNTQPLGLANSSNLIEYPCLGVLKVNMEQFEMYISNYCTLLKVQ